MANRKFWLGMLVMVLVFGMAVVGCGGEDDSGYGRPFFTNTININDIPTTRNGESFTISLLDGSQVGTSGSGIVVNGRASVELEYNPGSYITISGTDAFGNTYRYWSAHIAIKIGNDSLVITKAAVKFRVSNEGDIGGITPFWYKTTHLTHYDDPDWPN
jgi:hypothetical protein